MHQEFVRFTIPSGDYGVDIYDSDAGFYTKFNQHYQGSRDTEYYTDLLTDSEGQVKDNVANLLTSINNDDVKNLIIDELQGHFHDLFFFKQLADGDLLVLAEVCNDYNFWEEESESHQVDSLYRVMREHNLSEFYNFPLIKKVYND